MNKKAKKKIWIISLVLVGLVIIGFVSNIGISLFKDASIERQAMELSIPSTFQLTEDDSLIIGKKYLNQINVIEVVRNKVRSPISLLTVDDKYALVVYRIDLAKDTPLNHIFQAHVKGEYISPGYSYGYLLSGNYELYFKSYLSKTDTVALAPKIYLTLSGDSIRPFVINDSIIEYHLLCSGFSIKYSDSSDVPLDIVGRINEKRTDRIKSIASDMLFFKKGKSLYFLLLSVYNGQNLVPDNLLYKIVTNS